MKVFLLLLPRRRPFIAGGSRAEAASPAAFCGRHAAGSAREGIRLLPAMLAACALFLSACAGAGGGENVMDSVRLSGTMQTQISVGTSF